MSGNRNKRITNPAGRGGFGDHPEHINREGAPKRGQAWGDAVRRITDMTRDELIAYVGARTRIGRLLRELPAGIPLRDALIISAVIAFGREPTSAMLTALADREDGKPVTPVDVTSGGEPILRRVGIDVDKL